MIGAMAPEERTFVEKLVVAEETARVRLDRFLSAAFQDYSRAFLQKAIRAGAVTVEGQAKKPGTPVKAGERIRVELPLLVEERLQPEAMDLDVLYEDEHLLAVNKPPNLVVHPSRGHGRGTLANGLLHYCRQNLSDANGPLRPGIVHRLDRDTSGVILCAKTNRAHAGLAALFKDRRIHKEYVAVARGRMEHDSGEIVLPIGRDFRMRQKMRVRSEGGRPAVSRFYVVERFERFTIVRVKPRTGRTHQIRVHLSSQRHPVAADALYGGGEAVYPHEVAGRSPEPDERPLIARQALHARHIEFRHPVTGEEMRIEAPIPEDMARLMEALRQGAKRRSCR